MSVILALSRGMQEDQEFRASLRYLSSLRKSWDTQNLGESGSGRDVNVLRKARPLGLHSEHWSLEKKAYFVLAQTETILAKNRNPANAYTVSSSSPRSIILFLCPFIYGRANLGSTVCLYTRLPAHHGEASMLVTSLSGFLFLLLYQSHCYIRYLDFFTNMMFSSLEPQQRDGACRPGSSTMGLFFCLLAPAGNS